MLAHEARGLASDWLFANCVGAPGFIGAFLSGSVAWMKPEASVSKASDIDLVVVFEDSDQPPGSGKRAWKQAVLEIKYLTLDAIADVEAVLSDYHLAGALWRNAVLADPTGKIAKITHEIGNEFTKACWVRRRMAQVRDRAHQRVARFRDADELHDRVTTFFFGAGLCPHMILVADLANPTIRRRYAASQPVLKRYRRLDYHERLLTTLGSRTWSRQVAERHLADVTAAFDLACSITRSPYRFASDMSLAARPMAIDGSSEMIQSGFPREAAFWLITVMSRSRAVITMDGSADQLAWFDTVYWRLLQALGISDENAMDMRANEASNDIADCWTLCCEMLTSAVSPEGR